MVDTVLVIYLTFIEFIVLAQLLDYPVLYV